MRPRALSAFQHTTRITSHVLAPRFFPCSPLPALQILFNLLSRAVEAKLYEGGAAVSARLLRRMQFSRARAQQGVRVCAQQREELGLWAASRWSPCRSMFSRWRSYMVSDGLVG